MRWQIHLLARHGDILFIFFITRDLFVIQIQAKVTSPSTTCSDFLSGYIFFSGREEDNQGDPEGEVLRGPGQDDLRGLRDRRVRGQAERHARRGQRQAHLQLAAGMERACNSCRIRTG